MITQKYLIVIVIKLRYCAKIKEEEDIVTENNEQNSRTLSK